ncbi:MAG: hypothetical protein IGS48_19065 [Oscillatoriales cyanobacterium C42_A2020_001]|nr:hypothetical protein [Leptolyngbyaceae cyanobacterium C42_A2020_001]
MNRLLAEPKNLLPLFPISFKRALIPIIEQPMTERHTCLCCSRILLRHINLEGIYWRCSHCYQTMPV